MMTLRVTLCLLLGLIVTLSSGCGKEPKKVDETERNLRKIVQAYWVMCSVPPGRSPQNHEDIAKALSQTGEKRPVDEVLRSPRDGEPIVIYYGQTFDAEMSDFILAHEKKGKDGKRYVVTIGQVIKLLSDEEFAMAKFPGEHSPQ